MAELQSLLQDNAAGALALAGGLLGLAFGFLAARANFCVMGAISDYRTFASAGRLGAVALATATALILTQGLSAAAVHCFQEALKRLDRVSAGTELRQLREPRPGNSAQEENHGSHYA